MGTELNETYEASDLRGQCPKCRSNELYVIGEKRDREYEVLYTSVYCNNCHLEFNIAND